MKELELRKHAVCIACGQKIGHTGLPLFWVITVERYGIQLDAVRRQDGLTALLGGNAVLAQVMGTDREMATPVMDPVKVTLCERCAVDKPHLVAVLAELGQEKQMEDENADSG